MDIVAVGLNHKTAPIEIRERFAFSEEEVLSILPRLQDALSANEVLLLPTCNRTEVVLVDREADSVSGDAAFHTLSKLRSWESRLNGYIYEHHNDDAIRHLFRVAAGLDSMILGEPQILGQMRKAYALASQAGTNGLYINRIFHRAFSAGKRVRTETELGFGGVSIAHVAVTLARKVFGKLDNKAALIIGSGEMAEAAAAYLQELQIHSLYFVNRTFEKAQHLALTYGGEPVRFEQLSLAMGKADLVVSSTSAPGHILTHKEFHQVMDRRHSRPIFLADLAMPRDIDPEINNHENAFLFDIDSLRNVADKNLMRRRQAIPAAERIVEEEIAGYHRWEENMRIEPIVKLLHERFNQVRKCEVNKSLSNFCDKEADDLEKLTLLIQKKLLHRPTELLRECDPCTEEGRITLDVVRKLFDLR